MLSLKALTRSQEERGGGAPSGLSVAMDGHSQAHMDDGMNTSC